MQLTTNFFFAQINFRYCPVYDDENVLDPGFFLQMLYSFEPRKFGAFLALGRQYPRNNHEQWEIAKLIHIFSSSHSLQAMIVKKGHSVLSSAIFWVTFVVTSKNNTRFKHSVKKESYLSLCACFAREWDTKMTSKVSLTHAFSCFVVHGPKKAPNSLTLKRHKIRRKNPGSKLFCQSNQGSS